MSSPQRTLLLAAVLLPAAAAAPGADWPQWRGPALNGSSPETGLPATWTTTENVRWAAEMPGRGGGTPIVWGDRVFVTSVANRERNLAALCLDRKTGKVLWAESLGRAKDLIYKRNTMASCSAATDGKRVYFLYGNGELAATGLDGKLIWRRNLQRDHGKWSVYYGYSASPMLYGGKLFVSVLHRDSKDPADDAPRQEHRVSYLLCIDPASGKDVWKHVRPTDAVGECQESYATPMPCQGRGKPSVLVAGGDYLTAHDVTDGRELWRWGNYNVKNEKWWRVVASPLVIDDVVVMATPQHGPLYAIRVEAGGDLKLGHQAWCRPVDQLTPDCSTPLCYKGLVYFLHDDKKTMVCVEPKTGTERWRGVLPVKQKIMRASPTGADDKIYCISQDGEAVVVAAGGDTCKVLHSVAMGGKPVWSSIAVARGNLFLRTGKKLYCVGK